AIAQRHFDIVLERAPSALRKARVHAKLVGLHYGAGRSEMAVEAACRAFNLLGVPLRARPPRVAVIAKLVALKLLMLRKGISIEGLAELPRAHDERSEILADLCVNLLPAAKDVDNNLFGLACLYVVEESIRRGLSDASAICVICLGNFFGVLGDAEACRTWGL